MTQKFALKFLMVKSLAKAELAGVTSINQLYLLLCS